MNVTDPVGAGLVESMARPGGNITGFSNFEYSMSGKWAELLKQIAPNVTRALVFRDPTSAAGIGQFAAIRSVAQSLGVELTPGNVRDTDEIERAMAGFARSGNRGVIVTTGGTAAHRKLIISLNPDWPWHRIRHPSALRQIYRNQAVSCLRSCHGGHWYQLCHSKNN
jgi:putative ABC transport system substrate-binding protein